MKTYYGEMTYKDLYQMWKKQRSGVGWRPDQAKEEKFLEWIYDKIVSGW